MAPAVAPGAVENQTLAGPGSAQGQPADCGDLGQGLAQGHPRDVDDTQVDLAGKALQLGEVL